MTKPTKLTASRRAEFLERLADNGGIVTDAAAHIGMNRCYMYEFRDKDNSTCRKFREQWEKAQKVGDRRLRDEAIRRAFVGVPEPVIYQGAICTQTDKDGNVVPITIRKYSDGLMKTLLAGKFPEYSRHQTELSGPDGAPLIPANVHVWVPDNGRNELPDDDDEDDGE